MRIKENEFKVGNYIFTECSFDGGFGREAEIYEIMEVTAKSIKIKKVCERVNFGPIGNERVNFIDNDEIKTVEVKKVTKKDIYYWKLGQKYAVITDSCNEESIVWPDTQFTSFNDIEDKGSFYDFIR